MRLAPVSLEEARDVFKLRSARLLKGMHVRPPADIDALARVIQVVSHLLVESTEIRELNLNPCIVHEEGKGATIVDTRILLS